MYRMTHAAPNPQTSWQRLHTLTVRTYRQIAAVLEEREGTPISEDRVAHICKKAEMKLIDALHDDPVLGKRYGLHRSRPSG